MLKKSATGRIHRTSRMSSRTSMEVQTDEVSVPLEMPVNVNEDNQSCMLSSLQVEIKTYTLIKTYTHEVLLCKGPCEERSYYHPV